MYMRWSVTCDDINFESIDREPQQKCETGSRIVNTPIDSIWHFIRQSSFLNTTDHSEPSNKVVVELKHQNGKTIRSYKFSLRNSFFFREFIISFLIGSF